MRSRSGVAWHQNTMCTMWSGQVLSGYMDAARLLPSRAPRPHRLVRRLGSPVYHIGSLPAVRSGYFLGMVLLCFLLLQVMVWPWKSQLLNLIDATMTALVICMLMAATSLIPSTGMASTDVSDPEIGSSRSQLAANVVVVCFFICVFIIAGFVTFEAVNTVRSMSMPEEEKNKSSGFLLKQRHQVARIRVIIEAHHNWNVQETIDERTTRGARALPACRCHTWNVQETIDERTARGARALPACRRCQPALQNPCDA